MDNPKKATSPTPPKERLKSKSQKPGYLTANPKSYNIFKFIRNDLKKNPTNAENILWDFLKNKKTGHKIRRQHVIDNYIADFVCLPKKIVFEIDGKIHQYQQEYDEMRTERFNELDYKIIRFTNEEVFENPLQVFEKIKVILDKADDQSSPPLEGRGEVNDNKTDKSSVERQDE